MKHFLSIMLMVIFANAAMAGSFKAVYKGVTFDCKTEGNGVTITAFTTGADKVTIPAVVEGMKVLKVSTFVNGCNYLATELIIEEGVECIDKYCFNEFRKLRLVILPSTIKTIGSNAFRNNTGMVFHIPSSLDEASIRKGNKCIATSLTPEEQQHQAELMAMAIEQIYAAKSQAEKERLEEQAQKEEQLALAKEQAEAAKAQREKEKQEAQAQREKEKQEEQARREVDMALAKEKAEIERAQRAQELEAKRLELLALQEKNRQAREEREQAKELARLEKQAEKDQASADKGGGIGAITGTIGSWFGGGKKKKNKEVAQAPQQEKAEVVAAATPAPEPEVPKRILSDVDIDIPVNKDIQENTYCFIIANEKYDDLPVVDFAENDGNTFREYCIKALGVPERNVFFYPNAAFIQMTRAFQKMENLASATDGKSKFIFYYAGHGSPSEADQSAYLVPSDGVVTVSSTCFKLADIYARFGKMKATSVTVLLDACFSGLNRDNGGLMAARAVARKPKAETVTGNVVVLSATSDAETAMAYKEKGHGLFTYHLLHALKEAKGKVNFGDLYNTVSEGVRRDAIIVNDKQQTPSMSISPTLRNTWKTKQF